MPGTRRRSVLEDAGRPRGRGATVGLALAAGVAWLPFVARPLRPDEGGFLLVAAQWGPGSSLYGNYWVDRPPLLIGLFRLADLAGGVVALRLLGVAAVIGSVLLAAHLGRVAVSPRAGGYAAATAAVFMSTPLFGATEVDGELLAVPFVLVGLVAVHHAWSSHRQGTAALWWAGAGAAGVGAALVKQNMVEVLVLVVVVAGLCVWRRRVPDAVRALAWTATGRSVVLTGVLVWAQQLGTGPLALWDAVVTFRGAAAAVISASSTASTPHRAAELVVAFAASGALVLLVTAAVPAAHRADTPTSPVARARGRRGPTALGAGATAAVVLGWETSAVALGGSFWLHYLIGMVPGLVLTALVVVELHAPRLMWLRAGLTYAATVAVTTTLVAFTHQQPHDDQAVIGYLDAHAALGDSAVVAFGNPSILEASHLSSPYPELWSLPVRVRDPRLSMFTTVLTGAHRPTWVVVQGTGLATWGVDASTAQPVLDREYRLVDVDGGYRIYRRR